MVTNVSNAPTKAPGNKPNAGRWTKGQSGNPNGRPKTALTERLACRALNEQTRAVLVELLASDDEDIRFKAACRIRDEANGKPVQSVQLEQEEEDELSRMTEEQLWEIVNQGKAS